MNEKENKSIDLFKIYNTVSVATNIHHPENGYFISFYNEDIHGNTSDDIGIKLDKGTAEDLYKMLGIYLNK